MEKLLTETELADLLEISVLTIRRNRSTAPHRLPPAVRFGGSVRYQLRTVQKWLDEHEVGGLTVKQATDSIEGKPPKKEKRAGPGRPSKSETVRKTKNSDK